MKNIFMSLLVLTAVAYAHDKESKVEKKESKKEITIKHSGGTNSSGCHYNHKTGGYHCH